MNLNDHGFVVEKTALEPGTLDVLRRNLFVAGEAGTRCLLDHPVVREVAIRLHLDDCDETNGPLRISPGSHKEGILKSTEIPDHLSTHGETTCLAQEGEVLLMNVLALHASSKAVGPKHRRVLHLVYYGGEPLVEKWHREV